MSALFLGQVGECEVDIRSFHVHTLDDEAMADQAKTFFSLGQPSLGRSGFG